VQDPILPAVKTRRVSVAIACAGTLAAACCVSGCGAGAAASIDPIARAAEVTTHSGGAQLAMTMQMSVNGKQVSLNAHGDLDMARQEGEIFVDLPGLSTLTEGKVPDGTTMTELFTGNSLYTSSPLFAGVLPSGAQWMKADLGKFEQKAGINPQSLTSGEADPAQYLQYLRASSGAVTKVGTATVRGVPTTQYSATIDLTKEISQLGKGDSTAEAELRSMFAETGMSSVPVQAWIDSKNRLRRLQMQMNMSVSGQSLQMTISEELFGFGPIPAVNAPPSSEVYEPSLPTLGS
jgi:hypothetical protein